MEFDLLPLTFQQVVIFLTTVREKGFARAGEQLHMTQSTISKNIAKMEKTLNLSLFHRTTREVRLTRAGEELYASWAPIMEEFVRGYQLSLSLQAEETDFLQIGLVNAIHPDVYFGDFLKYYESRNPKIRLSLRTGNVQKLELGLLNGQYDAITMPDFDRFWAKQNGLSYQWIARANANIIVASDHPLARFSELRTEQIIEYDFNIPNYLNNNAYFMDLEARFAPYGKKPNTVSVYSSAHDMKFLFRDKNHSLIFLDAFFEYPETKGIKRIPVIDQKNGIICVWNPKHAKTSLKRFLEQCRLPDTMS